MTIKVLYQSVDNREGYTVNYDNCADAAKAIKYQIGNLGEKESHYAVSNDGVATATPINCTMWDIHKAANQ